MNNLKKIYTLAIFCLSAFSLLAQTTTVTGKLFGVSNNVRITLTGENISMSTTIDAEGNYRFENVPVGINVAILPIIEDDFVLNGISTFDMVLGIKHIMSDTKFDSPRQYLAADIDNSQSVTILDLVLMRRLIFNMDTQLTQRPSWFFVMEEEYNAITYNNETYEGTITIPFEFTVATEMIVNFVAIKTGDISGNAEG